MTRRQIRTARLAAVQRKHSEPDSEWPDTDQPDDEGGIDCECVMPPDAPEPPYVPSAWPFAGGRA